MQATDPATAAAWTLAAVNALILRLVHDAGVNEGNVNASLVYAAFAATGGFMETAAAKGTKASYAHQGYVLKPYKPDTYQRRGRQPHKVA